MGLKDKAEACGRCAMTTVVDVTDVNGGKDPFAGDRIEVPEDKLRAISKHVVVLGKVKHRLNKWATDITYGRSS